MIAARDYRPIPKSSRLKKSRRASPTYSLVNSRKIAKMSSNQDKVYYYLQFLLFINKVSATFAFFLVTLTLGVYGWTVRVPSLWSQEFRKLTKLQQEERYLVGANEVLKHQLAQQAEKPEVGLTQLHPKDLIFLPDVKVVPLSVTDATISNQGTPWVAEAPIAY
ncbi:MAG: hypothetical protein ACTMUB_03085 [cyanobacterium endosymbiont of Rhopalodia musculus]|uniref:hypothetical protein n=1 Tax=cyanobacterium endosymbiont of Epithemia clementina EcSB TaxID=3034674 RepID=UPI00247FB093|nr:hypothetical protein [cyanobacterium endosymbiont of Epithemia clementina EcSB]WGT67198.1 hypothetical protein P3F56_08240 [cyanobacterium endosymbiont of Epithemia clementina EcSB]